MLGIRRKCAIERLATTRGRVLNVDALDRHPIVVPVLHR